VERAGDQDRERLLDRLAGTLTVTRRAMPEQAQQGLAGRTRTKPRRSRRGSKSLLRPASAAWRTRALTLAEMLEPFIIRRSKSPDAP